MVCNFLHKIVYNVNKKAANDGVKFLETQGKQSLRDITYEKIREDILHGILRPGERIVEGSLCEAYKIGRSRVRTIISQLENEGLITVIPNKGASVSKISIEEIKEIFNIRAVLEGYSVRLTCGRVTKSQIAYLEKLNRNLREAASKVDSFSWLSNNLDFHSFLQKASKNSHLLRIVEDLRVRVFRYQYLSISITRQFETYLKQHAEVIKHIKNNKPAFAEKAMAEHLTTVRDILLDDLSKFPGL